MAFKSYRQMLKVSKRSPDAASKMASGMTDEDWQRLPKKLDRSPMQKAVLRRIKNRSRDGAPRDGTDGFVDD